MWFKTEKETTKVDGMLNGVRGVKQVTTTNPAILFSY